MAMPDGRVGHAEIQIGDSRVMLADESPEMGARAPQTVGGTPVHIHYVVQPVTRVSFLDAAELPPTPRGEAGFGSTGR